MATSVDKTYDAFVSYSRTDKEVARAVHKGLRRTARRWNQMHALRVFIDEHDIPAGASLNPLLQEAVEDSRFLVLIASPKSAQSRYVNEEVEAFLRSAPGAEERVLIGSAGARLLWSDETHSFDPAGSDLPPAVLNAFATEPTRVNLLTGEETKLDDYSATRKLAIVAIAAPIHGKKPHELESDDGKAHKVRQRIIRVTAVALAALAVLALWQWRDAVDQKNVAQEQRSIAEVRAAAQAALAEVDLSPALSLALAGWATQSDGPVVFEGQDALVSIRSQLSDPNPFFRSTLPVEEGPVLAVDADPESGTFVTGSIGGTLILWSAEENAPLAQAELPIRLIDVVFVGGPTRIAALGSDLVTTRLFFIDFSPTLEDSSALPEIIESVTKLDGFASSLATNDDRSQLMVGLSNASECPDSGSCGWLLRLDAGGELIEKVASERTPGVGDAVWLPGTDKLVVAVGDAANLEDADVAQLQTWSSEPLRPDEDLLGHLLAVESVAVDPLGRYIVSIAGGLFAEPEIYVWPTENLARPLRLATSDLIAISDVAISPDGSRLAVSAASTTGLAIWDIAVDGEQIEARGPDTHAVGPGGAFDLAFLSHRELVIGASDGAARIIDLDFAGIPLGAVIKSPHAGQATTVVAAADQSIVGLGSADGTVEIRDASDSQLVATLSGGPGQGVASLSFGGPGGTSLVIARSLLATIGDLGGVPSLLGELGSEIEVYEVADPMRPQQIGPTIDVSSFVVAVDITDDGQLIAATAVTSGLDFAVLLLDRETGERREVADDASSVLADAHSAVFVPGTQRLLVGSSDGSITELGGAGIQVERTIETGSDSAIDRLAISDDGQRLVAASTAGTVFTWAPGRWSEPPQQAQRTRIAAMALSHDGLTLAVHNTNSVESQLELFDLSGGLVPIGRPLGLREFVLADRQLLDLEATQFWPGAGDRLADELGLDRAELDDLLARSGRSPTQLRIALEQTGVLASLENGSTLPEIEERVGMPLVVTIDLLLRSGQTLGIDTNNGLLDSGVPAQISFVGETTPLVLVPLNGGGYQAIDVLAPEKACEYARTYLTPLEFPRLVDHAFCLGAGPD